MKHIVTIQEANPIDDTKFIGIIRKHKQYAAMTTTRSKRFANVKTALACMEKRGYQFTEEQTAAVEKESLSRKNNRVPE